jgi:hypothetical protein
VRARANHPDVVYDLAQQQIGREWRREFLQIISESVAVCTMLFSVTGLDFLISRQSVLSGQFDMMVWCGWLPLMYFFLRTSGAGIWRRNPFAYKINFTPSTLSPEEEATTIQREISNLEERLAEIQDSQTAVTRPANRRV